MGLQPWLGITIALYSAEYCYVPIPKLLCFCSTRLRHHIGSITQSGISSLCPSISSFCTGSSAHLGISCIHARISNSPLFYPWCCPFTPMRVPITPSTPPSFLKYFIQGCPKPCFCLLLIIPCISPVSSSLISLLPCTHNKNRPQRHPLCHCTLSTSNVRHLRLGYHCFPHFFHPGSNPHPVWIPPRPLPMIFCRNPLCVPSTVLSINNESYPVYKPNMSTNCITTL